MRPRPEFLWLMVLVFLTPVFHVAFAQTDSLKTKGIQETSVRKVLGNSPFGDNFKLSGGIYLFDFLPVNGEFDNSFEIYAFLLNIDAVTDDGRFGLHTQNRIRDTKLRSFYPSVIWFQEAYAFAKTPIGDFHAGKFYRRVGIFWDASFFGNIQYFNGLKLNPDFGMELLGSKNASEKTKLSYSVQYFSNNDGIDGSLADRDVESDPQAKLFNTVTIRLQPEFKLGSGLSIAPGLSGLIGKIDRTAGEDFYLRQIAGDLTVQAGKVKLMLEILKQDGEKQSPVNPRLGYDNATYYLAGIHSQITERIYAYANFTLADYDGAQAKDYEFLPGLEYKIANSFSLILEYNNWQFKPDGQAASPVFENLDLVFHYSF